MEEITEEVEVETPPPALPKPKPIQRGLQIPKNEAGLQSRLFLKNY